ncbi:MAG TPA: hypothetical protein PLB89_07555 [Flavobacteriales bacterium]|nr:hypothetical protein [Flavobacteriales bacterium]
MEQKTSIRRSIAKAALMLYALFGAAVVGSTQETVTMKGRVIVPAHVRTHVDLTMDVGDTSCVRVTLQGRGKFRIETSDDELYLLRFEQDGSISKTVQVDTKYAQRKAGVRKRIVVFDVQLAPVDTVVPLRYAGPVGKIRFHHSNGRMQVERDRHLVQPFVVTEK